MNLESQELWRSDNFELKFPPYYSSRTSRGELERTDWKERRQERGKERKNDRKRESKKDIN